MFNQLYIKFLIAFSIVLSFSYSQDVYLTLDGSNLNYESTADIAGFQFNHNGCVSGASGGDAASNGFTISASGSTVLAFSFTGAVVPAGAGILVVLDGDPSYDCLSNFIFSDSQGGALSVDWPGSTDDGGDDGNADDGGDTGGDDGGPTGDNVLSIVGSSVLAGESTTIDISLENPNDIVAGFEIYLYNYR